MIQSLKVGVSISYLLFSASSLWATDTELDEKEERKICTEVKQLIQLTGQLSLSPDQEVSEKRPVPYSTAVEKTDLVTLSELFQENKSAISLLDKIYFSVCDHNKKKNRTSSMKESHAEKLKQAFIHFVGMMQFHYDHELDQYLKSLGALNHATGSMKKCDMEPIREKYVLPYQRLCNGMIEIFEKTGVIPHGKPYGQITVPGTEFGVFYHYGEGGYLAHSYNLRGSYAAGDIFSGLVDGVHQRMFIFENGEHMDDWGFAMSFDNKVPCFGMHSLKVVPVRGVNSDLPFTAGRLTKTLLFGDPNDVAETNFGQSLLMAMGDDFFMKRKSGFLRFPTKSRESAITELLFLESLTEDASHEDNDIRTKAITYIEVIEQVSNAPIAAIITDLEHEIKADIESTLREEEAPSVPLPATSSAANSTVVPTRKVQSKSGKRRTGKQSQFQHRDKSHAGAVQTISAEDVLRMREEKVQALFNEFKVSTRKKYREYLNIQSNIIKKFPESLVKRALSHVSKSGSHFNLHTASGKGLTFVRKHGSSDTTVPPSRVNNFSLNLIQTLIDHMDDAEITSIRPSVSTAKFNG
ncbi:MAG: hypothetical protein ACTHJ4_07730 [Candidatus Nucleicultricaceae bacterium]